MRDRRGTEMNSSPRISSQSACTGSIFVKKRCPPMSKRNSLYRTVREMPPTASSASRTVVRTPAFDSRYPAVRPAGPAPMMTTCSPGRSGATTRGGGVSAPRSSVTGSEEEMQLSVVVPFHRNLVEFEPVPCRSSSRGAQSTRRNDAPRNNRRGRRRAGRSGGRREGERRPTAGHRRPARPGRRQKRRRCRRAGRCARVRRQRRGHQLRGHWLRSRGRLIVRSRCGRGLWRVR